MVSYHIFPNPKPKPVKFDKSIHTISENYTSGNIYGKSPYEKSVKPLNSLILLSKTILLT
jgi:hypothetical protein